MQSLNSHLIALWRAGTISYEEMITKAQDPEELLQQIGGQQQ